MNKNITLIAVTAILFGCKSEDVITNDKPVIIPSMIADAMLVQLEGKGVHNIDIKSFISTPDSTTNISNLTSIDYESSACTLLDYSLNSIMVEATEFGHCEFKVKFDRTVNDVSEEITSNLFVNISSFNDQPVNTISELTTQGRKVAFDLSIKPETKVLIEQGYTLDHSNISLFGDAQLGANENTIEFTASNNLGLNRIFYFLKKVEGGVTLDSKPGVIDVTVTNSANVGPVIEIKDYSQQGHTNTFYNFDLRNSKVVSDADNIEELQIISLASPLGGSLRLGTSEAPLDPNSEAAKHNMAFHFSIDRIGNYPITYTVTDHKGGYVTGYVRFESGLLTSPNSPSANKPGRMIESVEVKDEIDRQLLTRPKLLSELPVAYQNEAIESSAESWALLDRSSASNYCKTLNLELPTSEAFKALLVGKESLTADLGWPSVQDSTNQTIPYLVRETRNTLVSTNPTINPLTGELTASNRGLVTCVPYVDSTILVQNDRIQLNDITPQQNIALGNDKERYLDIKCSSSDPAVSVTCSDTSVTITGHSPLNTEITVLVDSNGESLNGVEESNTIQVLSRVDAALPQITDLAIDAFIDTNGDGIVEKHQIKRMHVSDSEYLRLVRPPSFGNIGTELSTRWTYTQANNSAQGDSLVEWVNQTSGDVVSNENSLISSQHTGNDHGVIARVTPVSAFGEIGTRTPLELRYQHDNPEINNLLMFDNQNTARGFTSLDNLVPTYSYTDLNNDPKKSETFIWQAKKQWEPNWTTIEAPHSSWFHTGELKGHDVRLTVRATDSYDKLSNQITTQAFPIAASQNAEVIYKPLHSKDPLSYMHLGEISTTGQTVDTLFETCQTNYAVGQLHGTGGLLPTLNELQQLLHDENRPRYYHPLYQEFYYVPYKNASGSISWLDLNTKGTDITPLNGKAGLVCVNKKMSPTEVTVRARYSGDKTIYNVSLTNKDNIYDVRSVGLEVKQTSLSRSAVSQDYEVGFDLSNSKTAESYLYSNTKQDPYDVIKNEITSVKVIDKKGRLVRINGDRLKIYSDVPFIYHNRSVASRPNSQNNSQMSLHYYKGVLNTISQDQIRLAKGDIACDMWKYPAGGGNKWLGRGAHRIVNYEAQSEINSFNHNGRRFDGKGGDFGTQDGSFGPEILVAQGHACYDYFSFKIEGTEFPQTLVKLDWDMIKSPDLEVIEKFYPTKQDLTSVYTANFSN